jgi:hypothetical protein
MTLRTPWPPYPDFVRDLQARVWTWDPVRLAEFEPPKDEYDCIVTPLSGWLRARLAPDEVASRLTNFVGDHFGYQPSGTDEFAASTVAWYRTIDPADE